MRRALLLMAISGILAVACSGDNAATSSPTPTATIDIKRAKLDIAYSAFVDQDVHHVTSKKALEAALNAVKAEVRAAGGKDDVETPAFQDTDEPLIADFKKFADVVSQLAARNTQLSANRLADAAIAGMIKASPDCHTYYVDNSGQVRNSSGKTPTGTGPMIPAEGTSLGGPDQAGVTGKILAGGVAYITWHEFAINGTYRITDSVKAMLDKALAQGAKAWLFDLRGNLGGNGADAMASWFLNGEPTLSVVVKTGNAGTATANKDLRLPAAYQLPIAVIQNDRGGSAPEVLSASLKENKRATIVGRQSVGCLGATSPTHMTDNSELSVTVQEFTGAVTGTKYNNNGVPPDVAADDQSAVDVAAKLLLDKIAAGSRPP
jgi:C-terminal processing protease CtpA/Prc